MESYHHTGNIHLFFIQIKGKHQFALLIKPESVHWYWLFLSLLFTTSYYIRNKLCILWEHIHFNFYVCSIPHEWLWKHETPAGWIVPPVSNMLVQIWSCRLALCKCPVRFCFRIPTILTANHSGGDIWGTKCLRSLQHWDRGFESHWKHGCLCVFILCLCCPVCR
jgi:hypothetical protein